MGGVGDDTLSEYFFGQGGINWAEDDLFAIFESLDSVTLTPLEEQAVAAAAATVSEEASTARLVSQKSTSSSVLLLQDSEGTTDDQLESNDSPKSKRQKTTAAAAAAAAAAVNSSDEAAANNNSNDPQKTSHITVERNRRKQMNEHLSVLRSFMPGFYVKRGDQASIIGGVVEYINELQQVLQSLEAKKQRKVYSEVLSPRLVVSSSPLSPRKPPLSPRINNQSIISPGTPQPGSPYNNKPRILQQQQQGYLSPTKANNNSNSVEPSPCSSSSSSIIIDSTNNELVANSKSAIAQVEVKFSGPNLVLKTVSSRIPGQALKIMSALEELALEILHVSISTVDETMYNSFTIKIGIECQLSAEELAQQVQQTFC